MIIVQPGDLVRACPKNAMKLIHDISGGVLRKTGNAAWLSMIKAFDHKSTQVEKEHVQMVLDN